MKVLDNILTSGHEFTDNDGLQRFRFAILNVFLVLPGITTLINILTSYFGLIEYGDEFEKATMFYFLAVVILIVILRKGKSYYTVVVSLFILFTFILFYFVLLTRTEDEFRLIAFFLGMFVTYVLLGKAIGIALALFVGVSILIISKHYELGISSFAYSSFFTFFIAFAGLLYCFLHKIEKDALEFKILNDRLQEKIEYETSQRMKQEQMLLRRSRMANMGEMLDAIAHQWRQPLMQINSILLNIETAVDALSGKEKEKEKLQYKLDDVARLTTHMSQTIDDFRGLFKVEKEFTSFNIQDVIGDVLTLLKNNLNNIEVEHFNDKEYLVLGHRSELMQVIIIVLSNSIDVLNTRRFENRKISINVESFKNTACINIEDNAGGISSKNEGKIFDPYFTTKEQSGGTGLGLYIAKIIVEHNMEGEIVASNTAAGVRFSISFVNEPTRILSNNK